MASKLENCFLFYKDQFQLEFSKILDKKLIHFNDDTEILLDYIMTFCNTKKCIINSFSALKENGVTCYMKFRLQPKKHKKKFQDFLFDVKNYYIISGVVIMPYAKSLLENENYEIDRYMIDTTWRN